MPALHLQTLSRETGLPVTMRDRNKFQASMRQHTQASQRRAGPQRGGDDGSSSSGDGCAAPPSGQLARSTLICSGAYSDASLRAHEMLSEMMQQLGACEALLLQHCTPDVRAKMRRCGGQYTELCRRQQAGGSKMLPALPVAMAEPRDT